MSIFLGCGYQLRTDPIKNHTQTIYDIKSIILCSYDPFGPITRSIRTELYKNKINVIAYEQKIQIPCLNVINTTENHITIFVFEDGTEAGYQLILNVQTILKMSHQNCYPINVCISRTFVKNPDNALSNNIQENDIRSEMYQDAAQQIVRQLFLIYES